jgi:phage repressor protein C with HTH and peptisase S24 domain
MLNHKQVWSAIDALAAHYDLSVSGLARRAGLDATTFNKSKRQTADGRERWPGTESIARILQATGASFEEFAALASTAAANASARLRPVPLIGLAQAGAGGFFDDAGFPVGGGWEEVSFPGLTDENAYALEISGDSMAPLFREGDIIIVSPSAALRRGDRVVVKTREGEVLAKSLQRKTATTLELASLNPDHEMRTLRRAEVDWIARILWVSQ